MVSRAWNKWFGLPSLPRSVCGLIFSYLSSSISTTRSNIRNMKEHNSISLFTFTMDNPYFLLKNLVLHGRIQ
jgi:hypothetical protein